MWSVKLIRWRRKGKITCNICSLDTSAPSSWSSPYIYRFIIGFYETNLLVFVMVASVFFPGVLTRVNCLLHHFLDVMTIHLFQNIVVIALKLKFGSVHQDLIQQLQCQFQSQLYHKNAALQFHMLVLVFVQVHQN